jgi:AMMECR1 domain-containing protein
VASACDPRFPPLCKEEFADVAIEVFAQQTGIDTTAKKKPGAIDPGQGA